MEHINFIVAHAEDFVQEDEYLTLEGVYHILQMIVRDNTAGGNIIPVLCFGDYGEF